MAFSGTFTPPSAQLSVSTRRPQRPGDADPIADARELLRQAIRLPYEAARSQDWLARFGQCVTGASRAIGRHITRAELPGSPIEELASELPHLRPILAQQVVEHPHLVAQADALTRAAGEPESADIWRMIDLSEKATLLEIALARHQNRLARMVYESTHRELGEAG